MEQRRDFSVEGVVEVGPRTDYFVFLDREQLGEVFSPRLGRSRGPASTLGWGGADHRGVARRRRGNRRGFPHLAMARNVGVDFVALSQT
jgi:hypothetical protein